MELDKVGISKCTYGDTRTAKYMPTIAQFTYANKLHKEDVERTMDSFANLISQIGNIHDRTKIGEPYRTQFYNDFRDTLEGRLDDFTKGSWYQSHVNEERHHLLDRVPDDVNFVDIVEMICDVICAGKARSGEVVFPELDAELLIKAYKNTFDMVNEAVEV